MRSGCIKAVIFDYGGVLARTVDQAPRAAWERDLGLAPGTLTAAVHDKQLWVAAQNGSITSDAHWQAVGEALGLSEAQLRELRGSFYGGDVLNHELLACIDRLRQRGMTLGLLSNFSTDLRGMLATQDLLRRFDHVAISAEIGVMKPDAAAYEAILGMLALPASACVFIDDLPANVAAARALGMHGIVFEDTALVPGGSGRIAARTALERFSFVCPVMVGQTFLSVHGGTVPPSAQAESLRHLVKATALPGHCMAICLSKGSTLQRRRAHPAGLRHVDDDAVGSAVLDLDVGMMGASHPHPERLVDVVARRCVGGAQLGGDVVQAFHLKADVVQAAPLLAALRAGHGVVLELENGNVDVAVAEVITGSARPVQLGNFFQTEHLGVKLGRLVRVLRRKGNVLDLRHVGFSF